MILKDDVTAAIRRAFQLGQTYWQQADSESYKENKKADATRDRYNALCIETAEIAARADTRIAEIERECSQWRDELRIYRETENKRIAELERSVTVRDTEIARLETDLELARRDAEYLRLFARIRFGYAPGDYFGICHCCKAHFIGDKRAMNCESCADKAIDAARAGNGGDG